MSRAARVYIGVGANLGRRVETVVAACESLRALAVDGVVTRSPLYESAPLGREEQPDYVNAVATLATTLEPSALLAALHEIERGAGRVRPAPRWSARTLDLDLLLYGERTIGTAALTVPHPGIAERAFVLRPLADLAPALELPGLGPLGARLAACADVATLRPLIPGAVHDGRETPGGGAFACPDEGARG